MFMFQRKGAVGWKASVARGCSSITPVSPEIYPPCFGLSWSSWICCIVYARTDCHRLFWLLPSLVILALFRPHLCPFEEHLEVVLKYRLSREKFLLMMSRSNINQVKCKMWRYEKERSFESPKLQSSRCLVTIMCVTGPLPCSPPFFHSQQELLLWTRWCVAENILQISHQGERGITLLTLNVISRE